MKLCILADNGSVHIQKWVHTISQFREIELHIITFDRGEKYAEVVYHYLTRCTKSKLDFILNILLVRKIIRAIQPDILHAHYATSYGMLGAFSNFHPLIITGWGADIFDSPKNPFVKTIIKYSLKKADAITVLSKITQKELEKLTTKKAELIPFGVDTKIFSPSKIVLDKKIRIGTIRTLSEKYGVEYLIRAFALVNIKYDNLQLEIVGDGELMGFLKQLSVELKVEDKIIFHGFVSQINEFPNYINILNSFDIFAILSVIDSETFGVAAVEASACGIPVVASNVGGLPEVVEDGVTGILVPVKDVSAIAEALKKLVLDKNLREQMGKNGRMKVEKEFNWENNIRQMIDLYKNIFVR